MDNVKLDKFGRVLIPKAMRDALNVDSQQELQLSIEHGAFVLKPTRTAVVQIVDGFPLLEVEHVENALERIREERDQKLSSV